MAITQPTAIAPQHVDTILIAELGQAHGTATRAADAMLALKDIAHGEDRAIIVDDLRTALRLAREDFDALAALLDLGDRSRCGE